MSGLFIGEVAKISFVSIRTLRHYDAIGLLKPSYREQSGYRKYSKDDLIRLQAILFYKELEFPLKEIKRLLDSDQHEHIERLEFQKEALIKRKNRIEILIQTINKTIDKMKQNEPLKDEELYEGFTEQEISAIKKEVIESYDPKIVAQSQERIAKMSKQDWKSNQDLAQSINRRLAGMMHKPIQSEEVQLLISEHYHWINQFYDCTKEMYVGLAQLYVNDSRFKAYYETLAPGLADFLSKSMQLFAEQKL